MRNCNPKGSAFMVNLLLLSGFFSAEVTKQCCVWYSKWRAYGSDKRDSSYFSLTASCDFHITIRCPGLETCFNESRKFPTTRGKFTSELTVTASFTHSHTHTSLTVSSANTVSVLTAHPQNRDIYNHTLTCSTCYKFCFYTDIFTGVKETRDKQGKREGLSLFLGKTFMSPALKPNVFPRRW